TAGRCRSCAPAGGRGLEPPGTLRARQRVRAHRHAGDRETLMNRHAGPPGRHDAPVVPEPTYAERARTLAHLGRTGTLATLSRRHPGHPFGSVMPYALDVEGRPLLLISAMAMHTQNLEADARASLLVTQPDWSGDPLAAGRLTLMGQARRLDTAHAGP